MKKAIVFSFIIISRVCLFAQFEPEQDTKYKWQISAAINSVEAQMNQPLYDSWYWAYTNIYGYFGDRTDKSYSLSIIPKYSITDDIKLRFELGITDIKILSSFNGINDSNATSNETLIKQDTLLQKIYRFIPGIQWSFIKSTHIEAYCGLSLSYLHYSEAKWWDYLANNQTGGFDRWTATATGGFAAGIGGFSGFNINIYKTISIGAELSSTLQYYKLGGTFDGWHESSSFVNGPRRFSISNSSAKGFQFSKVMYSFHINIAF